MADRVIRLATCKYCPFMEHARIRGVERTPVCAKTGLDLPHVMGKDSMGVIYALPTYVIPDECPLELFKEG